MHKQTARKLWQILLASATVYHAASSLVATQFLYKSQMQDENFKPPVFRQKIETNRPSIPFFSTIDTIRVHSVLIMSGWEGGRARRQTDNIVKAPHLRFRFLHMWNAHTLWNEEILAEIAGEVQNDAQMSRFVIHKRLETAICELSMSSIVVSLVSSHLSHCPFRRLSWKLEKDANGSHGLMKWTE